MNSAQEMNLGQLLTQTSQQFPERIGLIQGEQEWTWRQLQKRVHAMAYALQQLGVQKGDKILTQSRNNVQMFESCWVALQLGCVWVPTNFRLSPSEVAYLAQSSHANVIICESVYEQHIDAALAAAPTLKHVIAIGLARHSEQNYENLVALNLGKQPLETVVAYDDPLWYFYTSGTTGKPKAGILTHGQMSFVVTNHLADLIPGTNENDCSIAVAPLSHGAGIHALLNVARGATTILLPTEKLIPEMFWQLVEKHRVTNLFTVPTIVKILVEDESVDRYDHSSLKYMIYAGAPMYRADQKYALQKLGNVLVQYFGLGEVTGCITVLPRHMHSADDANPNANIGSCGRPRTGMQLAILKDDLSPAARGEIGEICCRGPAVFSGYYGNAEATQKALRGGWFHTGDLGYVDERGFLFISGRQSDMYISGGSNVYPKEVEEVILNHPDVAEVAIVGMPDPKWGEIGVAIIVKRDEQKDLTTEDILTFLDGKTARYRWPRHIQFWSALPKSGYGKVAKKDIQALLQQQEHSQ